MQIAVLGDIHSNLTNLEKALEKIKNRRIRQIIVVGDLQSPETIDIIGSTSIKSSIVLGNADFDVDAFFTQAKRYKGIEIFKRFGEIELNKKRIGFCHFIDEAKKMAKTGKYDVVFSGHGHSPTEENISGVLYIRPGEIAGQYYKPTFCVFDLEKMSSELVLI